MARYYGINKLAKEKFIKYLLEREGFSIK